MKKKLTIILFVISIFGAYFFLKYSSQNYVSLEKVIQGDYSGISNKETRQMVQEVLQQRLEEVEWIYKDLNGDNRSDLILQETMQCEETYMNRIIGIFCVVENEIICMLWDTVDGTEFFGLCNNQLVYYKQYYGTFDKESYELYQYDQKWNIRLIGGMEVYYIEDMKEMPSDWSINYPEMIREGIYYMKFYVQENGDECHKSYIVMEEEQWKEEFNVLFKQEYFN